MWHSEAILLYVVFDVSATVLEVPSGYMSDVLGRKLTLIVSAVFGLLGIVFLAFGASFEVFLLGQVMLGAATAFSSGTDIALLFESLVATDRQNEVEEQELKAWRFTFIALALSAATGGLLALYSLVLPFFVSILSAFAVLVISWHFTEPPRSSTKFATKLLSIFNSSSSISRKCWKEA